MVPLNFPVVNENDLQPHDRSYLCPIRIENVVIDPFAQEIRWKGKTVKLTRIEFRLLWILVSDPDSVFSRNELLSRVWGEGVFVEPRTVDAHIARLRQIFRKETELSSSIETVWGIGYCFKNRNGQSEGQ